ncbi:AraC family transcriptional regulator N-terminal domain-containing protein [Cohnella rhizosphaerae]|uniref:AraC family transcriptional regulator N-terminal domain-containing protein n=1 Tax=Cohnella rhizosphaerae TaxID=1457232 RepID=UPI003B8A63CB
MVWVALRTLQPFHRHRRSRHKKNIFLGNERFTYGPSKYVVASMDWPIVMESPDASPEAPNLFCRIAFTPDMRTWQLKGWRRLTPLVWT